MCKRAEIIVFNVGFGDAIYIEIIEGDETIKTFLIDCGYPNKIEAGLKYLHDKRKEINYIILTHKHSDHIAGLIKVLGEGFEVKNVIMRMDDIERSASESNRRMLEALDEKNGFFLDLFHSKAKRILSDFVVLYPIEGEAKVHCKANRNSIALALGINDKYLLFMGDATKAEEKIILNRQEIYAQKGMELSKACYVKIGHHGSKSSTGLPFIESLSKNTKNVGIISCNYGGPPPHKKIIEGRWKGELKYTRDAHVQGFIKVKFDEDVECL